MRFRSLGIVALMALVAASCGGGVASEAAGPSEGIQVHGDWIIDIFNADGSLDRHVEFSNALLPTGAAELVQILAASHTSSGSWQIVLYNDPAAATNDPCGTVSVPVPCVIGGAQGLAVEFQPDEGRVHLDGSFTADIDGHLRMVQTKLGVCTTPTACDYVAFSETHAPPNPDDGSIQTVNAGQAVQVQVDISFSSG